MASTPGRGDPISLIATEPWELVSVVGDRPLSGRIVDIDQDAATLIIRLDRPMSYMGKQAAFFLAKPRHLSSGFGDGQRRQAFCGLTSISSYQAGGDIPSSPKHATGDIVLLGDLSW